MDRLSAYAARESESDSPEDRQNAETEATTRLLEKIKLASEAKPTDGETDENAQQNGDAPNDAAEAEAEAPKPATEQPSSGDSQNGTNGDGDVKKSRGIPDNVRLFEVFHEQVIHLVNMQRLPIQDITALLVSLINLAL